MLSSDLQEQTLIGLFEQLGLGSNQDDIERFVDTHRPIPGMMSLADAPFWNDSQALFIRESIDQDADWVIAIGKLDALLR